MPDPRPRLRCRWLPLHRPRLYLLYARARRVCQALGLKEPHTHTLPEESGASLRGAGWVELEPTRGGEWSREGRDREPGLVGVKRRWSAPDAR